MSCHDCGAPLAADQRYCLECGTRAGAPLPVRLAAIAPAPVALAEAGSRLPSPRALATLVLLLLGFGVAVGAAAGPQAGAQLAARPDLAIELPPAAPAPAPAPVAAVPPAEAAPAAAPAPEAPSAPSAPAPAAAPPASAPASAPDTSTTPAPAPAPKPKAPPLEHVWVVSLAEQPYARTFDNPQDMPYLARDLRARGEVLSHFHPAGNSGLSAGLGLLDGAPGTPEQDQNCPVYADGPCVMSTESFSILDQLASNGGSWKAYAESIPAPCAHPALGRPDPPGERFSTARVAPLYFHAVIDAPDCAEHVAGLDALAGDLAKPPSLSLVVPDLTHDGRGDLAAADAWLKQTLEPILDSKAYEKGGLVVVTTDHTPDGSPAGALLLSKYVKGGTEVAQRYDGFSLLRALQDAFGLRHLAATEDDKRPRFGASVWTNWSQDVHASDTGS